MDDFEKLLKQEPDPVASEELLKRLEKKALAEKQAEFKEAVGKKVWRTADGRYLNMSEMTDNHLLNAFHVVEKNINAYLSKTNYNTPESREKAFATLRIGKEAEIPLHIRTALGTQIKGYKHLYDEIQERNLFQKTLEKETDNIFDLLNNLSKDNDETQ